MAKRRPVSVKVVDLFAGVGGFSLGFLARSQQRKSDVVWDVRCLVDTDAEAAYTFKRNLPNVRYAVQDVRSLTPPKLKELAGGWPEVLIGGPPCQGFSRLGKRELDDPRNELVSAFLMLAKTMRVPCIVMENVPHFKHGGLARECVELLQPDYHSEVRLLRAEMFGVPQIRRRAFLLAVRSDLRKALPSFPRPTSSTPMSVSEAIDDLPQLGPGEGRDPCRYLDKARTPYQRARRKGATLLFNHIARRHSGGFLKKISVIPEGGRNLELPRRLRFSDTYFSQAYARLSALKPAYTITTCFLNPGSGRFLHYRELRSLTVREAARIQGFDDSFVFHGTAEQQARHIGNAVPPLLGAAWAKALEGLFQ